MKNLIQLSIFFFSWCITVVEAHSCYYIKPDNQVIEYRAPFVRSHEVVTMSRVGAYDDFLGFNTARKRNVNTHFPAGFYYIGSDERYDLSVGRNILYSIVEGSNGTIKKLLVWREVASVTEEKVYQDAIAHRNKRIILTSVIGLCGIAAVTGILWNSDRSFYNKALWTSLGATFGGAFGYLCGSSKRLMDEEYMPATSQELLLELMAQTDDDRLEHITLRDRTYILEKTLDIEDPSSSSQPHIDHFVISRATRADVQRVKNGNHASQGVLAYALPDDVMIYKGRK